MDKTPNIGLNRYTFDDLPDIRQITDDNDTLDNEIRALSETKANVLDVTAKDDFTVTRYDGGNLLKGGEDVFELPPGIYWTLDRETTQSIKNRPPKVEARSIIEVMSSNGSGGNWRNIRWTTFSTAEVVVYTAYSTFDDGVNIYWTDWQSDSDMIEKTEFSFAPEFEKNIVNTIWKNRFGEVGFSLGMYDPNNGDWGDGKTVATIPVGFTPIEPIMAACHIEPGAYAGTLEANPNGVVTLYTKNPTVRYIRAGGVWQTK